MTKIEEQIITRKYQECKQMRKEFLKDAEEAEANNLNEKAKFLRECAQNINYFLGGIHSVAIMFNVDVKSGEEESE